MTHAPAPSVASAATAGDTVVSIESHRTRLSRVAKMNVAASASRSPRTRTCSGRSRSLISKKPPATMRTAPATSTATSGSSSKTTAITIEKSGAVPMTTDVRAAPASRTANVKRYCDTPGPSRPASTNGHTVASTPPCTTAKGNTTAIATSTVKRAPPSASAS